MKTKSKKSLSRKMLFNTSFKALFLAAASSAMLAAQAPAHAVVLEQQWKAGQQLSYDLKMDGTMRVTAPAEMPMIGGLPLEILLNGEGQSTLDTREVDEFGTALVAPCLERLHVKLNETTFDQNGVLGYRDGRANFSLNGQSMASNMDWSNLINPRFGLRISKQGRVLGTKAFENAAPPNENKADGETAKKPGRLPFPIDAPAMIQAMIARTLPTLWPGRDVNIGDTWSAKIEWPLPPNATRAATQNPIGQFDFKAVREEEIAGRKTMRISLDGNLKVSEEQSKIIAEETEKYRTDKPDDQKKTQPARMFRLFAGVQSIKGDMWFDPAAGQLVRADLRLHSQAETRSEKEKASKGELDFSGKFSMELRKVSYASETQ